MKKSVFNCIHADTCLPDSWPGHHELHIQIPVYHGMRFSAVRQDV